MKEAGTKFIVDADDYKMLVADQTRLMAVTDYICYMHDTDGIVDTNVILALAGLNDLAEQYAKERKSYYEKLVSEKNSD